VLAGATPTTATPTGRDEFVDTVRAAAILRVVLVHAIGPLGWFWWPAPYWIMPGMPLVFFCSGALMFQSLDRRPQAQWHVVRSRLRRLLVPCLAVLTAMVAVSAALAAITGKTRYQLDWSGWYTWLIWNVPTPSVAVRAHDGQLWFAGTFTILLASSPILARLHRYHLALPLALIAGLSVAVFVRSPGQALNHLAMYAPFFCAGFYYGDGTLVRVRERSGPLPFVAGTALLAALSVVVFLRDGRNPNAAVTSAVTVAGAWLMLLLAARPAVQMLGRRWERGVGWVSRRSLSIYLAGWPAASAARRSANALLGVDQIGSAVWAAVFLALTFAFIVAGTAMIFPVEELARRPVGQWFRSTDTSTVAA
jgi:peptidoglycan/LPS O-acetylase OafA/YrhL